ncbi:MAG: outer membrane beta-barrel protein [Bdellovibrionales bacterium]
MRLQRAIFSILMCAVATTFSRPGLAAEKAAAEPFAFADFTWLNGNSRQTDFPLTTKYFTPQFSIDTNYVHQFSRPKDHTLVGSTNSGRTGEFQVEQVGVGGDFNYENVRGRIMTQFGMYSTMTPRNDASSSRGQWHLDDAYRYLSEAYGGYHWDVMNGINLDVGIFMSYVGLCSYYNYENWVYQMSYVSANTPWFFNGARLQIFPTDKFKAELWLVNGWQSYGMFNEAPGVGWQLLYRPSGDWSFVTNEYIGEDWMGIPGRARGHTDTSAQHKYYDNPANTLSKAAVSLTVDLGCEWGGGVNCGNQNFVGFMLYNRVWFAHDKFGLTLGTGRISNPGRYLVLVPPVNGATAYSGDGSGAYTANAGDPFHAWDASVTFDYMPKQFITYRLEYIHREADVPYFAGHGGITPPDASGNPVNQGPAGSAVAGYTPDLVKTEDRVNVAMMVRF